MISNPQTAITVPTILILVNNQNKILEEGFHLLVILAIQITTLL